MSLRTILVLAGALLALLILLLTCTSERSLALDSTPSVQSASAFTPPAVSIDAQLSRHAAILRTGEARDPNKPFKPLPPNGTPLRDVLAAMKVQASEGDAAAACWIALSLNRCGKLAFSRRVLRSMEGSKGAGEAFGRALAKQVEESESSCDNLADEEIDWTFDYALAAAMAGNREARYQVVRSYSVGLDWFHPERSLESWARWRQNVGALIQAGVRDGDARVMSEASWAYHDASHGYRIFPEDIPRSLAMRMAVANAAPPETRKRIEKEIDINIYQQQYEASLVEQARAIAREMNVKTSTIGDPSRPSGPDGDPRACETS